MLFTCSEITPPFASSVSLHGFYQHGHETLLAQVKGSLRNSHGFQLAVCGDLRHSLADFAHLPPALGLDASLGQSDMFTDGSAISTPPPRRGGTWGDFDFLILQDRSASE